MIKISKISTFFKDVDLELESIDKGPKNETGENANDGEEQRPRKRSRKISVLSAEIDGKKAVSFFGALRIPVTSNFHLMQNYDVNLIEINILNLF